MVCSESCPGNHIFICAIHDAFYASPATVDKGRIKEVKPVKAEVKEKTIYEKYGEAYGIDPRLLKAIAKVESGENPELIGDGGESFGLCQIQKKYHEDRMKRLGVSNLLDPEQNVLVACDFLSELVERYGNLEMALSAYNSGSPYGAPEYAKRVLEVAYGKK